MLPSIFGESLFDEFFDDAFGKHFMDPERALYGKNARNLMKTDVRDTGDGYDLSLDLPGFSKDEIQVDLKDGYLTVTAAKGLDKDENDQNGRYIRRERYAGSCTRSFYVGDVRPEEVHGKYESGVLCLTIPKKETRMVEAPSRIAIE